MPSEIKVYNTPSEDTFEAVVDDNRFLIYDLPEPIHDHCKFIGKLDGDPYSLIDGHEVIWSTLPQNVQKAIIVVTCDSCLDALNGREIDHEKAIALLKNLRTLIETP